MQLLIPDRTYADFEGDAEVWHAQLRDELATLGAPYETSTADIGPGASWPMVLAIFSVAGSLFFLGDKIEKNLNAWLSLARRFRSLLSRLRAKHGPVRVDTDGAGLIATEYLLTSAGPIESILKISETIIPITPFGDRDPMRLDARYDALYILSYIVNGQRLYVIGMKSSGDVEFSHEFGADFMTF